MNRACPRFFAFPNSQSYPVQHHNLPVLPFLVNRGRLAIRRRVSGFARLVFRYFAEWYFGVILRPGEPSVRATACGIFHNTDIAQSSDPENLGNTSQHCEFLRIERLIQPPLQNHFERNAAQLFVMMAADCSDGERMGLQFHRDVRPNRPLHYSRHPTHTPNQISINLIKPCVATPCTLSEERACVVQYCEGTPAAGNVEGILRASSHSPAVGTHITKRCRSSVQ